MQYSISETQGRKRISGYFKDTSFASDPTVFKNGPGMVKICVSGPKALKSASVWLGAGDNWAEAIFPRYSLVRCLERFQHSFAVHRPTDDKRILQFEQLAILPLS